MNIANKLTITRIMLTFIFMLFLFCQGLAAKLAAFFIFSVAALTDYLDGFFAKKFNMTSNFGIIMDPIADKILVLGSFLAFVEMDIIPAWMVVLIMLREFLVTGIRIFALSKGKVLKAQRSGKHKTMSQIVTIFVILLFLIFKELALKFDVWTEKANLSFSWSILCLMTLTVILTTTSGISFLWDNRNLINNK